MRRGGAGTERGAREKDFIGEANIAFLKIKGGMRFPTLKVYSSAVSVLYYLRQGAPGRAIRLDLFNAEASRAKSEGLTRTSLVAMIAPTLRRYT